MTSTDAPADPLPASASVLVVGAGLAGLRTVATLRAHGHDGPLHLVGAEPHAPYDRPPLSKHLLDRPGPLDLGEDLGVDLAALGVDVRLGTRVTRLDVDGTGFRALLAPGDVPLVVDAVVLATGAAATRMPGWEAALTLHTLDDADRLRAALADAERPRLVVVGAGWIGAEVAGVAAAAGADVTVVEAGDAPLAAALGAVGARTAPWYDAAGVRLLTRAVVTDVRADGVTLADGTELAADVVLAAVGARPAPAPPGSLGELLPRAADGGVLVDAGMRPLGNAPGLARVRVVGDAAVRASARHGLVPGGHWDAALTGPDAAALSLLDPSADLPDPAPYVFSTQLGHDLALLGRPGPDDDVVLRGEPGAGDGWAALWFAPEVAADGGAVDEAAAGATAVEATPDTRPSGSARTLTAVLTVDRPRDTAAARRLFRAGALPRLDPALVSDPTTRLR